MLSTTQTTTRIPKPLSIRRSSVLVWFYTLILAMGGGGGGGGGRKDYNHCHSFTFLPSLSPLTTTRRLYDTRNVQDTDSLLQQGVRNVAHSSSSRRTTTPTTTSLPLALLPPPLSSLFLADNNNSRRRKRVGASWPPQRRQQKDSLLLRMDSNNPNNDAANHGSDGRPSPFSWQDLAAQWSTINNGGGSGEGASKSKRAAPPESPTTKTPQQPPPPQHSKYASLAQEWAAMNREGGGNTAGARWTGTAHNGSRNQYQVPQQPPQQPPPPQQQPPPQSQQQQQTHSLDSQQGDSQFMPNMKELEQQAQDYAAMTSYRPSTNSYYYNQQQQQQQQQQYHNNKNVASNPGEGGYFRGTQSPPSQQQQQQQQQQYQTPPPSPTMQNNPNSIPPSPPPPSSAADLLAREWTTMNREPAATFSPAFSSSLPGQQQQPQQQQGGRGEQQSRGTNSIPASPLPVPAKPRPSSYGTNSIDNLAKQWAAINRERSTEYSANAKMKQQQQQPLQPQKVSPPPSPPKTPSVADLAKEWAAMNNAKEEEEDSNNKLYQNTLFSSRAPKTTTTTTTTTELPMSTAERIAAGASFVQSPPSASSSDHDEDKANPKSSSSSTRNDKGSETYRRQQQQQQELPRPPPPAERSFWSSWKPPTRIAAEPQPSSYSSSNPKQSNHDFLQSSNVPPPSSSSSTSSNFPRQPPQSSSYNSGDKGPFRPPPPLYPKQDIPSVVDRFAAADVTPIPLWPPAPSPENQNMKIRAPPVSSPSPPPQVDISNPFAFQRPLDLGNVQRELMKGLMRPSLSDTAAKGEADAANQAKEARAMNTGDTRANGDAGDAIVVIDVDDDDDTRDGRRSRPPKNPESFYPPTRDAPQQTPLPRQSQDYSQGEQDVPPYGDKASSSSSSSRSGAVVGRYRSEALDGSRKLQPGERNVPSMMEDNSLDPYDYGEGDQPHYMPDASLHQNRYPPQAEDELGRQPRQRRGEEPPPRTDPSSFPPHSKDSPQGNVGGSDAVETRPWDAPILPTSGQRFSQAPALDWQSYFEKQQPKPKEEDFSWNPSAQQNPKMDGDNNSMVSRMPREVVDANPGQRPEFREDVDANLGQKGGSRGDLPSRNSEHLYSNDDRAFDAETQANIRRGSREMPWDVDSFPHDEAEDQQHPQAYSQQGVGESATPWDAYAPHPQDPEESQSSSKSYDDPQQMYGRQHHQGELGMAWGADDLPHRYSYDPQASEDRNLYRLGTPEPWDIAPSSYPMANQRDPRENFDDANVAADEDPFLPSQKASGRPQLSAGQQSNEQQEMPYGGGSPPMNSWVRHPDPSETSESQVIYFGERRVPSDNDSRSAQSFSSGQSASEISHDQGYARQGGVPSGSSRTGNSEEGQPASDSSYIPRKQQERLPGGASGAQDVGAGRSVEESYVRDQDYNQGHERSLDGRRTANAAGYEASLQGSEEDTSPVKWLGETPGVNVHQHDLAALTKPTAGPKQPPRTQHSFNATLALSVDRDPNKLTGQDTAAIKQLIRKTFGQGSESSASDESGLPFRKVVDVEYLGILDVESAGQKLGFWVSWKAFEKTSLSGFMERLNEELAAADFKKGPKKEHRKLFSPDKDVSPLDEKLPSHNRQKSPVDHDRTGEENIELLRRREPPKQPAFASRNHEIDEYRSSEAKTEAPAEAPFEEEPVELSDAEAKEEWKSFVKERVDADFQRHKVPGVSPAKTRPKNYYNATLALAVETDPSLLAPEDFEIIADAIRATLGQGKALEEEPPFRQVVEVAYIGIFDDLGDSPRLGYWISWKAFRETTLETFMERLNEQLARAPLSRPVLKKKKGKTNNENGIKAKPTKSLSSGEYKKPPPKEQRAVSAGRSNFFSKVEDRSAYDETASNLKRNGFSGFPGGRSLFAQVAEEAKRKAVQDSYGQEAQTAHDEEEDVETANSRQSNVFAGGRSLSGRSDEEEEDEDGYEAAVDQPNFQTEAERLAEELHRAEEEEALRLEEQARFLAKAEQKFVEESRAARELRLKQEAERREADEARRKVMGITDHEDSTTGGHSDESDGPRRTADPRKKAQSQINAAAEKRAEEARAKAEADSNAEEERIAREKFVRQAAEARLEDLARSRARSRAQQKHWGLMTESLNSEEDARLSMKYYQRMRDESRKAENVKKVTDAAPTNRATMDDSLSSKGVKEIGRKQSESPQKRETSTPLESGAPMREANRTDLESHVEIVSGDNPDDRSSQIENAFRDFTLGSLFPPSEPLPLIEEPNNSVFGLPQQSAEAVEKNLPLPAFYLKDYIPSNFSLPSQRLGENKSDGASFSLPGLSWENELSEMSYSLPRGNENETDSSISIFDPVSDNRNAQPLFWGANHSSTPFFTPKTPKMLTPAPLVVKDFNATLALSMDMFSNLVTSEEDTEVIAEAVLSTINQGKSDIHDSSFRQISFVENLGVVDLNDGGGPRVHYRISWSAFSETNLDGFMDRLNLEISRALANHQSNLNNNESDLQSTGTHYVEPSKDLSQNAETGAVTVEADEPVRDAECINIAEPEDIANRKEAEDVVGAQEQVAKKKELEQQLLKQEEERRRTKQREAEEFTQKLQEQFARKQQEKQVAEKRLEEERLARQKEEEKQLADKKREEERLARQKEEEQRLTDIKREEERLARQKEEEKQLADKMLEEERLARQKEAEHVVEKKLEDERLAKQKKEEQVAKLKEQELADAKKGEEQVAKLKEQEQLAEIKKREEELAKVKEQEQLAETMKKEEELAKQEEQEQRAEAKKREEELAKQEEQEQRAEAKKKEQELAKLKEQEQRAETKKREQELAKLKEEELLAEKREQEPAKLNEEELLAETQRREQDLAEQKKEELLAETQRREQELAEQKKEELLAEKQRREQELAKQKEEELLAEKQRREQELAEQKEEELLAETQRRERKLAKLKQEELLAETQKNEQELAKLKQEELLAETQKRDELLARQKQDEERLALLKGVQELANKREEKQLSAQQEEAAVAERKRAAESRQRSLLSARIQLETVRPIDKTTKRNVESVQQELTRKEDYSVFDTIDDLNAVADFSFFDFFRRNKKPKN
ncbi:hypothetical protein ACA910_021003 [Epithemia clementina (nom. ined.)]